MVKTVRNFLDNKKQAAIKRVGEWQGLVYSAIVFGATLVVMFWASVFLYTSFYFTYMPQESVMWPVHFRYESCGELPGICSNPTAVVSVTDPIKGSILSRGQKYRVVVDLEMPESPKNQRLGMFLIDMMMKSQGGELLRRASRSVMLRYRSPLLQTMALAAFAPFMLYGVSEEKQLVTAELFSQYEEDPLDPLSEVYIELETRHVELYAAQLRIHAVFTGLRYFMYHYPLTAAGMGIGICMVFLSAVVILSWYQFSTPTDQIGNPIILPNGQLTTTSTSTKNPAPLSSERRVTLKSEAVAKKDLDISPIKNLGDSADDFEVKSSCSDLEKTDDSSQLPESERRRDSDEFEVVSSTKLDSEDIDKRSRKSSYADEGESVVRQRVHHIAPEADESRPDE